MFKKILAGFISLTAVAATASATDVPLQKRLDPVIEQAIKDQRIVGAVVLVAKDGKVVYKKAAGLADREAKRPVTLKTQFRLASLTQPIVAAATLAVVEAEIFRLDEPIDKWLSGFKPKYGDGKEAEISIYQLLTHSAGLNYGYLEKKDGPYHQAKVSDGFDLSVKSFDENLQRIATAPLLYEPGTSWSYSIGYDLLGALLEKATKRTLPDLVGRTVLKPLGLKATTFTPKNSKQVAAQYTFAIPQPRKVAENDTLEIGTSPLAVAPGRVLDRKAYTSGGAGLVGTADDYLKFLEAIRKGGDPILDRAGVYSFTTNSLGLITSPVLGNGWGYGYGVAVLKNQGFAESLHSTGTWKLSGEYGSHFWVDQELGLTVVVLTNTAGTGTQERFLSDITRAVYGPDRNIPQPTITGTPATSVVDGKVYKFIPDSTDSASFSISNKPAWASFDVKTGGLTGTPKTTDIGKYADIVITATNVSGSVSLAKLDLEVVAPPPPAAPAAPVPAPAPIATEVPAAPK